MTTEAVRVVVRCRPLSDAERARGHESVISVDGARGSLELRDPGVPKNGAATSSVREFTFDACYGPESTQEAVYVESVRDVVASVLAGFNGTCFAYGQTGTGKTHTMEGTADDWGILPRAFAHIFQHIAEETASGKCQFLVRASYLEIYQEEIRDLLSRDPSARLELRERADTGVYVKELSSFVANSAEEMMHVMRVGNVNRAVGRTNMNEHSSRSHAIFVVTVECSERRIDDPNEQQIRVGRLNLVDLAGSERQSKSGAEGARLREATFINLSLSALGNVISALTDAKAAHVPYRDSKLTRLLQDSLGGNSRTVMLACVGPADYNHDESLGTLRYANRAKQIKNRPHINEDPKDALLRQFQEEIARLRTLLEQKAGSGGTVDRQKARIMADSRIEDAEKQRLLEALEQRPAELEKERAATSALEARLAAMQSKLLGSGSALLAGLGGGRQQQAADLERSTAELAEQKRRERDAQRALEQQDDEAGELSATFESLKQEVDAKRRRERKLLQRLQRMRIEAADAEAARGAEREDLDDSLAHLNKQLKLRLLLVDSFVPPDVRQRLVDASIWDEADGWRTADDVAVGVPDGDHGHQQQQLQQRPATSSSAGREQRLCSALLEAPPLVGASLPPSSSAPTTSSVTPTLVATEAADARKWFLASRPTSQPGLKRIATRAEWSALREAATGGRAKPPPFETNAGTAVLAPGVLESGSAACENLIQFGQLAKIDAPVRRLADVLAEVNQSPSAPAEEMRVQCTTQQQQQRPRSSRLRRPSSASRPVAVEAVANFPSRNQTESKNVPARNVQQTTTTTMSSSSSNSSSSPAVTGGRRNATERRASSLAPVPRSVGAVAQQPVFPKKQDTSSLSTPRTERLFELSASASTSSGFLNSLTNSNNPAEELCRSMGEEQTVANDIRQRLEALTPTSSSSSRLSRRSHSVAASRIPKPKLSAGLNVMSVSAISDRSRRTGFQLVSRLDGSGEALALENESDDEMQPTQKPTRHPRRKNTLDEAKHLLERSMMSSRYCKESSPPMTFERSLLLPARRNNPVARKTSTMSNSTTTSSMLLTTDRSISMSTYSSAFYLAEPTAQIASSPDGISLDKQISRCRMCSTARRRISKRSSRTIRIRLMMTMEEQRQRNRSKCTDSRIDWMQWAALFALVAILFDLLSIFSRIL